MRNVPHSYPTAARFDELTGTMFISISPSHQLYSALYMPVSISIEDRKGEVNECKQKGGDRVYDRRTEKIGNSIIGIY